MTKKENKIKSLKTTQKIGLAQIVIKKPYQEAVMNTRFSTGLGKNPLISVKQNQIIWNKN